MSVGPEYRSARTLLADLATRRVSSRELLDAAIARNADLHTKINAVVLFDIERARERAIQIDDSRVRGKSLGPLAGLPMTVKEVLDLEGLPATAANKSWNARASKTPDAAVVARAREAGAVIWGKTNAPFMAADYQTFNDTWGTTNNPYDQARTPGGSSGGATAALACGITPLEIGSDLGGSIRTPASFCGVVGLKPTWGILSQRGHVPPDPRYPRETDCGVVGPLARNVEDVRLLWRILSGRARASEPRRSAKGLRVATIAEEKDWPVAGRIKETIESTSAALFDSGALKAARPALNLDRLLDCYCRLVIPTIGADAPGGIYAFSRLVALFNSGFARRRVDFGNRLAMLSYLAASHRDWLRADSLRSQMKEAMGVYFQNVDAIIMPVAPTWAFPHDHRPNMFARKLIVDGTPHPYYSILCWIAMATVLHLPAVSVRAGTAPDGLPIGVQIVGPWDSEDELLDIAALVEERVGGFQPPSLQ